MANLTQFPGVPFNKVYGIVPVAVQGIGGADNFVVQVYDKTNTIKLADLRQSRNENDTALFDISRILQSFTFPSKKEIENTQGWSDSTEEVFEFKIRYGTETGGVVTIDGTAFFQFVAINGRKPKYELIWPANDYRPFVQGATCISAYNDEWAKALTDVEHYTAASSLDFTQYPSWVDSNQRFYRHTVRRDDYYTLSFLNSKRSFGVTFTGAKGVAGIRVATYDAFGGLLQEVLIPNIVTNGGGPDTTQFEYKDIQDPYWCVTAGVGLPNLQPYLDPSSIDYIKYYYVAPVMYQDIGGCPDFNDGYSNAMWYIHRFDVDNGTCLDTPLQFSWMNSFGFRDYFTFEKRNRKRDTINRNNYLQDPINWNGTSFSLDRRDRGYTTFSQEVAQTWEASTRYLRTHEADLLENLFISPEVRVNFGDGVFLPVVIESNSWEQIDDFKDRLRQLTIRFRLAENIQTQRG